MRHVNSSFSDKISFIWELADLLRGTYKRNEYQKAILPFIVLRRFDCILKDNKKDVLKIYEENKSEFDEVSEMDHILKKAANLQFYNYSQYDFGSLLEDPDNLEQNLNYYIDSFSGNIKDIFVHFELKHHIGRLAKAGKLFFLIKKFSDKKIDLHPNKVSNHEMGTIFEELIRKFSEQSNEESGEHFTPRDVVGLMTKLMFTLDKDELKKKNLVKTVYDPACGTGGMLTSAKNYILGINPNLNEQDIVLFGQESQPETYAVCKSDVLMKGAEANHIGGPSSTLSDDKFSDMKFDFIISNPPYGMKWEEDKDAVEAEAASGGRFDAGVPRINDGQLLFLQHMISKMKVNGEKTRIAAITNGSPLFTGDAGSGESNIRKFMIENDYIEAIIALPNQLFYNTGITTYIWVMNNKKPSERVGKIQLINAVDFYKKMRKSLGNKRNELDEKEHSEKILELYKKFEENKYSKILDNEAFGYTKIIVERPLQLNYSASKKRLDNLYSIKAFSSLSESKSRDPETKLREEEEGREKQVQIIESMKKIGDKLYKNWEVFENKVKLALAKFDFLKPAFQKQCILALSEHDETADYILDSKGKRLADSNLRDSEKIRLKDNVEKYFEKEVIPYYSDAWMDRKKDKIGYEINFTQYFYKYIPPRSLDSIEKDIEKISKEINYLMKENI